MMTNEFADSCIYTIVEAEKLAKAAAAGGRTTFSEKRPWVTGHDLWQQATRQNLRVPVLFADAADCTRLLYWGALSGVRLDGASTRYTLDRVRKLSGRHAPQELTLRSTGKKIAPNFIRPYAICITPLFLEGNRA